MTNIGSLFRVYPIDCPGAVNHSSVYYGGAAAAAVKLSGAHSSDLAHWARFPDDIRTVICCTPKSSQVSVCADLLGKTEQMGCRQLARSTVAVSTENHNDTDALCEPPVCAEAALKTPLKGQKQIIYRSE